MELLVGRADFARRVDHQGATGPATILGPVDDAADQADAGFLRGLTLSR
jgi:hypothetical protein